MLFLIAWGCARARLLGVVAMLLALAFLANPSRSRRRYKSDMQHIAATMDPLMHQRRHRRRRPARADAAQLVLPAGGLRFANTARGKLLTDPRYMDWVDALHAIKTTNPHHAVNHLVREMRSGQQLLFVRPLTEGAQNWKAPWTAVRPAALGTVGGGVAERRQQRQLDRAGDRARHLPGGVLRGRQRCPLPQAVGLDVDRDPPRPRSLTDGFGLPPLGDVHPPRVIRRAPRAVVAGGVLALLLVISWYIRTSEINGTLWFQEATAIGVATRSFGGVLHAAKVGGAAPLYYVLLHFWVGAVGDGVLGVRWLSLIFALVCIPVGGWAGWCLGGERGGFYGAVLFAFSSMLTQYSAQAQPYTLLILLGLVATTAFVHGFVYRRRRYLWLFVAATGGRALLAGQRGLPPVRRRLRIRRRRSGAPRRTPVAGRSGMRRSCCAAALLVLYLPWLPATIDQIAHATYPWHYTPLMATPLLPSDLLGGERVDADLLVIGTLAVAPFLITRSRRRDPDGVVLYALLAITFAALALGLVARSAAPTVVARYYASVAPALLLFGALAAARTKIVGFVATVLLLIMVADPAAFATSHPEQHERGGRAAGRPAAPWRPRRRGAARAGVARLVLPAVGRALGDHARAAR